MRRLALLFLLVFTQIKAQNNRKMFFGRVFNSLGELENVHIINLHTKKATSSNLKGEFRIFAKVNDSLQLSYIGYKTKIIHLTANDFGMEEEPIMLQKEIYELDEVVVKNHNLLGVLESDMKIIPANRRAEALAKTMDFSKINFDIVAPDDHIDKFVRPPESNVDPISLVAGAGASVIIPFGYSKRLWALRRDLKLKRSMPANLLSEFGKDFFFKELKIPIERYYHFLEYCNPLNIEDLYRKQATLEVIKILRRESKSYLKMINKADKKK